MAVLSGNLGRGGSTEAQIGALVDAVGEAQAAGRGTVRTPTLVSYEVPFSSLGPVLTGTGFAFDAAGNPTAGTVTGLDLVWNGKGAPTDPGGPRLSGVAVPLVELYDAGSRRQGAGLAPALLAGDDLFEHRAAPAFGVAVSAYGGDDVVDIDVGGGYGLPPSGAVDGGPGRDAAVLNQFYGGVADAVTPAGVALRYDIPGTLDPTGSMVFASVETLRFLDGSLYTDPDTTGGRAYALFLAVLGRAPDTVSLGHWDDAARSYGEEAAARGLLASPEGRARLGPPGDDAGFVAALYREALGREPEGAGLGFWTGRLSDGASRAAVVAGVAGSEEAQGGLAPAFGGGVFAANPLAIGVLRVELAAYGRVLDPDAVARGIEDLRSGRQTLRDREEVIAGVVSGAYDAGGARLSNAEFVDRVIRNAHGAPDPVASAYYTAQLDAGAGTLADVLHAYAFSPGIDARVAPYITDHGLVFA
jgi:hypothetical protein